MPAVPDQTAPNLKSLVGQILDEAHRCGATAAEVAVGNTTGLSVGVRKGEQETVEFNNDRGFGITVYVGERKGSASTSDASSDAAPPASVTVVGESCHSRCGRRR